MKDSYCSELVLVKETGVCVPKDGTAWGLSPRVVIGDPVSNPARRGPRWEGLMPTLSCVAGESMVINLGRSPFRYPIDGYQPLCQMVQADARFVLQVYSSAETLWEDVRPRYVLCAKDGLSTQQNCTETFLKVLSANSAEFNLVPITCGRPHRHPLILRRIQAVVWMGTIPRATLIGSTMRFVC